MDDYLTKFVPNIVASRRAHPPRRDAERMAVAYERFDEMVRSLACLPDEEIAATVCRWLRACGFVPK